MHRLATVHARDNQPTNDQPTIDQRRHDSRHSLSQQAVRLGGRHNMPRPVTFDLLTLKSVWVRIDAFVMMMMMIVFV